MADAGDKHEQEVMVAPGKHETIESSIVLTNDSTTS